MYCKLTFPLEGENRKWWKTYNKKEERKRKRKCKRVK
jgi:hypothetical protein